MGAMHGPAELLADLGLPSYQARVLVALTEEGPGDSVQIGQRADVPRTSVYGTCRALVAARLVAEVQEPGHRRWRSEGWAVILGHLAAAARKRHEQDLATVARLRELSARSEPRPVDPDRSPGWQGRALVRASRATPDPDGDMAGLLGGERD